MSTAAPPVDRDEERLAELGYKQDLKRGWSGFSNFAISFTIISVLAGCFTTYGQAWNNGGPIAISWGWPIIATFILVIAFCMAELVSAFPTSGGIYWWASKLGGPVWGWFTGWFNLIGLIAVVASVDYAAATFGSTLLGLYKVNFIFDWADPKHFLGQTFALFILILTMHALLNIFSSPLVALFNRISVFWHVTGVVVIVAILIFAPTQHQSLKFVFTHSINNSGFSHAMFAWFVLPIGGLMTMYTITGYDASAHISEETLGAADAAPKGVWRSVFYSAVIGWIVLLSITFAAKKTGFINDPKNGFGLGTSLAIFNSGIMSAAAAKTIILISTIGQLFCGMACLTSCSRMMYAFSRDRAVPGWKMWTRLNHHRVPAFAVVICAVLAAAITLPALKGDANNFTYAFLAVVSIATIGLYIAYTIPIYLRWRMGDAFEPGPWTLGAKYKWMCPVAFTWVTLCVIYFILPTSPLAVPWDNGFDARYANYAPVMLGSLLLVVGIWWLVRARHTFTGPVRTIDMDETGRVIDKGDGPPGPGDPAPAPA
jgi:amino acid transporter